MLKKSFVFFVMVVALLQVWHKSQIFAVFMKPVFSSSDYAIFSDEFRALILLAGLLLFWGVSKTEQPQEKHSGDSSKYWLFGFLSILVFSVAMVIFANPEGRFPWNKREAYIDIQARTIKPDLYKELTSPPDLIAFGSSVSFTLPADYFEKRWGLTAFNMALNGGGPIDFVNMLDFVISESPDAHPPSIVMVELVSPGLKISNPTKTPLELIRYMYSANDMAAVAGATIDHSIRITGLIDSVFTLAIIDQNRWLSQIEFFPDGTGVRRKSATETDQNYLNAVKRNVGLANLLLSCDGLDPLGKDAIERLVKLGREHQFSIVFYRTPVNADFYAVSKYKPSRYSQCRKLLDTYMQSVTQQNPNVFFKDLSRYKMIATGGKENYIDTHHLTPEGNVLVMEALHKQIESAIVWAQANR